MQQQQTHIHTRSILHRCYSSSSSLHGEQQLAEQKTWVYFTIFSLRIKKKYSILWQKVSGIFLLNLCIWFPNTLHTPPLYFCDVGFSFLYLAVFTGTAEEDFLTV